MPLTAMKTIILQTNRFTLSEQVSKLVGHGTPVLMSHLEEKLLGVACVTRVEVQSWGEPFVIDVEMDAQQAADRDLTLADIEERIGNVIDNHYLDYHRLEKFVAEGGGYPHGQKLVVSDNDYVVTLDEADKTYSVHYQKDDGVVHARIGADDYINEVISDLISENTANPLLIARGTNVIEEWVSRHSRGMSWYKGM